MKILNVLRLGTGLLFLLSVTLLTITAELMIEKRRWFDQVNNALSGYTLDERSIQFDLLDERVGLVRNYDSINDNLRSAGNNLSSLQRAALSTRSRRLLVDLVERTAQQEQQIERFNSDNALLQNSLAFLGSSSTIDPAYQELFNRILKLTLDTTPTTVKQAETELEHTSLKSAGAPSARFLFHARVLVEVLPVLLSLLAGKSVGFYFLNFPASSTEAPSGAGFDLSAVYAAWLAGLILLYPICQWYGKIKQRRPGFPFSYL